ncbi:MAG: response regulator [Bacteroidetes bacterium]|nr:response regulator [Bacteroidota bacterium]
MRILLFLSNLMSRVGLLIFCFLLCCSNGAQNIPAHIPEDIQKQVIHLDPAERLDSLLKITAVAKKVHGIEYTLAIKKEVLREARELNNDSLIAKTLLLLGQDYEDLGYYRIALSQYQEALATCNFDNKPILLGRIYNSSGISLDFLGNYSEALSNYLKADSLFLLLKDTLGHSNCYNNIGLIYFNQKNYKDAKNHFMEVLRLADLSSDQYLRALALSNLGMMAYEEKEFENAIRYYTETLQIDLQDDPPNPEFIGADFNSIGEAWALKGNFDSASYYFQIGLNYKRIAQSRRAIVTSYFQFAELLLNFARPQEAKLYLDSAYEDVFLISDPQVTLEYYRILARFYKDDHKPALQAKSLERYIELQDSLTKSENYELTKTLEEEFRFELREKDLENLESELQYQKSENRNMWVSLGIFAVLCIALVWLYILNQKKNSILKKQQVELEDALRTKTSFLSMVSHEIRTPIHVIMGMAENLLEQSAGEKDTESVRILHDSTRQLIQLVNDVLDLNKLEHGATRLNPAPFSFHLMMKTLCSAQEVQCQNKNLQFNYQADEEIPDMLLGDRIKLEQVLNNLLNNAIKFTDSGKIELKISQIQQEQNRIKLAFHILDTGIGIPASDIDKIFNPFFQSDGTIKRNFGGTGLGLAISKGLVELMGGQLRILSSSDLGTHLYFEIPFEKSQFSHIETAAVTSFEWPNSKRILVAEDHEQNRMLLRMLLSKIGAEADWTENGQECWNKAQETKYDLVLLDMHMPVMDGYQTAELLRQKYGKEIVIVALTAADKEEFQLKNKDQFDFILHKPYTQKELFAILKELIH